LRPRSEYFDKACEEHLQPKEEITPQGIEPELYSKDSENQPRGLAFKVIRPEKVQRDAHEKE